MTTSNNMHTPGPWWTDEEYCAEEAGIAIIAANTDCGPLPGNPTRGMVAWSSELLPEHADRCAANARLMAAAPDMLDALQLVLDTYGFDSSTDSSIWQTVTAAIAKATREAA